MFRYQKRWTACTVLLLTVSILLPSSLSAQNSVTSIFFFATETSTPDDSTIKLTENLFYNQFQAENILITDMRPAYITDYTQGRITLPASQEQAVLFGLELQKDKNAWVCRIKLLRQGDSAPTSFENTYESYYKILMDAKNLISQVLLYPQSNGQAETQTGNTAGNNAGIETKKTTVSPKAFSLDALAGTWKGESLIDKIIILRSGRGFVIFNNGASMNISITLKGNTLEAVQTGKPNASFFPDLPREVALAEATHAEPVAWIMSLHDADTLCGTKTTLLPSESDTSNAERRSISVTWKRL